MNEIKKRGLYGLIYVIIMWTATDISEISFHILFILILLLATYEMLRMKAKKSLLPFIIIIPLVLIHQIKNRDIILLMFCLTWMFDTCAYIFGINFGKHKIIPSISPKKSWEGFIGGALSTIIISYIITYFNLFKNINYTELYTISLFIPITASIGDFTISYYKRKSEIKDTGNLIPGHGGILDRIDAFLITIPVIYLINL